MCIASIMDDVFGFDPEPVSKPKPKVKPRAPAPSAKREAVDATTASQSAQAKQAKRAQLAAGTQSNILTGSRGVLTDPTVKRQTILGR